VAQVNHLPAVARLNERASVPLEDVHLVKRGVDLAVVVAEDAMRDWLPSPVSALNLAGRANLRRDAIGQRNK